MSGAPAAARFHARLATAEDEAGARALLASQAMGGAVRLAFAREPEISRAAGIEGEPHHGLVVCEEGSGRVVGYGSRAVKTVWVNGERARIGYLAQLRRAPDAAGRIGHLAMGFRLLAQTRRDGELPFDVTTILADNREARRLLEKGFARLPVYRPLGTLATTTLAVARRAPRPGGAARAATAADLAGIAACLERNGRRFQLASVWTAQDLASPVRCRGLAPADFQIVEHAGTVVGCVALWDQRAFKQTLIAGYARPLALSRPLLNLGFWASGRPLLPRPGSLLALAHLSHLAVDGDDPEVAAALVAAALAEAARRGLSYLALALGERHPLRAALAARFPGRRLESVVYLVYSHGREGCEPCLDDRPLHLEAATL